MKSLQSEIRLANLLLVAFLSIAGRASAETPIAIETNQRSINQSDSTCIDFIALMQQSAMEKSVALWGYWGMKSNVYSGCSTHSNRLIPVYTFNCSLAKYLSENSSYRRSERLTELYHRLPESTIDPSAIYADQTDIYRLQKDLIADGYNRIILIVFDGMDWQTTWIAATYATQRVAYRDGRGTGLSFQDYRGIETDYSYVVTSPYDSGGLVDVNAQRRLTGQRLDFGGYSARLGGPFPWSVPIDPAYVISKSRSTPHAFTDSSSAATSLTTGIKTFNGAVNVDESCKPVETIAQVLQRDHRWSVGAISSVPISHATPAATYAHNVSRDDYQDLTRDLLGLPSISTRDKPQSGLDVLIGAGWGVIDPVDEDAEQGFNYVPGNQYLTEADLIAATTRMNNPYVLAQRTEGKAGIDVLRQATEDAIENRKRLLGFFGTKYGHLPFRTANGDFKPVQDLAGIEVYSEADLMENPTLSDMAIAGLNVLSQNTNGFWVLIEAGDVDWANHKNNIDNSIGATLSGSDMVSDVFSWIESHGGWNKTAVIVTADHGHYFNVVDIEAFTRPTQE